MKRIILVAILATLSTGCAGLSKTDKEAINLLTPNQKQQLLYEMLKNEVNTPIYQPVYYHPYIQPVPPETHMYCYPSGYCYSY